MQREQNENDKLVNGVDVITTQGDDLHRLLADSAKTKTVPKREK